MVTEVLVEFPMEAGWYLLEEMDRQGLDITVAYWQFSSAEEEWQMVVASPLVKTIGPKAVIAQIQQLLAAMPAEKRASLSLRDILVVNPNLREVESMRDRYGRVAEQNRPVLQRGYWSRNTPFIYRLI
jgi:hypothetical protein